MIPIELLPFANHVWQSMVCTGVAGLLVVTLRKNRARIRYWLWWTASVKFLLPFSLFISLGGHWARPSRPAMQTTLSLAVEEISQPFTAPTKVQPAVRADSSPVTSRAPVVILSLWSLGFLCVSASWLRQWKRVRSVLRIASPVVIDAPIRAMSSPALLEPGVFGIVRPVLLLPEGITELLTPAQSKAILTHELCHVRHHDNLTAACHMVVEAVFWFNPVVWWLGARLVEERERACDEEVLRSGEEPSVYAEGILTVCEHYLKSPLPCVAAVTGSNLKKRIEAIMAGRAAAELSFARKLLLTSAAIAASVGPVGFGLLNAPQVRAQSQSKHLVFEVASVKPNNSADLGSGQFQFLPGGKLFIRNTPLLMIVAIAYNLPFQSQRLTGGPEWERARGEKYDIVAAAEPGAVPANLPARARDDKIKLMLQSLLEERFKLKMRREPKDQPVYAVVVAKDGPKLQRAKVQEKGCSSATSGIEEKCHSIMGGVGRGMHGEAVDIVDVALFVQNLTDRPVVDETGLTDLYNIQTEGWAPMRPRPPSPDGQPPQGGDAGLYDPDRQTLADVFRQLGLRMESQRAVVDIFVVEHVERPNPESYEPKAKRPEFEVASIKPHPSEDRRIIEMLPLPGGRFRGMSVTLKLLMSRAYSVQDYQISGGPGWLDSDRYDIEAKAEGGSDADLLERLQSLLEDRFKLSFHRERKEMPVYALLVLKSGLKLREADGECPQQPPGLPPMPTPGKLAPIPCGAMIMGRGQVSGEKIATADLARYLSRISGRPVIDKTGLTAKYGLKLEWSPDQSQVEPSPDSSGPSIYTALQEQLGLKLESQRAPVEVLVIDHAEKPSEN